MDPELLNYPEPAYRRHAKSLVNMEQMDSETDDGCDIDNPVNVCSMIKEEQLIDVNIEEESQSQIAENKALANSSYLELLASLVEPPSSTLDLLTSDIPDLMSNQDDTPAQLILETNNEPEEGGSGKRTSDHSRHRECPEERVNCESCKYYDDSHPFLV